MVVASSVLFFIFYEEKEVLQHHLSYLEPKTFNSYEI